MTKIKKPAPAAVVAFRATSEMLKAIDAIAKSKKQSRTDVITAALTYYVAENRAPAKAPGVKKPALPVIRAADVFAIPKTKPAQVKK